MVSDDAGQFKILGLLHGLCWLHAERSIRKLVPLGLREQIHQSLNRLRRIGCVNRPEHQMTRL